MDVAICLFVMKRLVVITNFHMVLEIWENKRFFFFFQAVQYPLVSLLDTFPFLVSFGGF